MSGKQFYHEAWYFRAAAANLKALKSAPDDLEEHISGLPDFTVASVADARLYISALTSRLLETLEHYGTVAHRKMRFQVGIPLSGSPCEIGSPCDPGE